MILRATLSLSFLLSTLSLALGEPALKRYSFSEPHMGTRFQILVYASRETQAKKAARAAFERIAALNAIMSDYDPASELMRLCRKSGGPPVKVSKDLFSVLSRAQKLADHSDGAFDVTIGPVVRLWRQARKTGKLPDRKALARARSLVGHDLIVFDRKAQTVQLKKKDMQLDLGGIAKGYAADEALAVLSKHGLKRALVAAGGDIRVGAAPPDKKGWTVAIAPLGRGQGSPGYFLLAGAAVSTSGDLEQFVVIDGKRYSHIVDPRTGLGVLGRFSVSVIAPRGSDSDSLATAISILGPERGRTLLEHYPGTSFRYVAQKDKERQVFTSKGFPKLIPIEGGTGEKSRTNHRDAEDTEKTKKRINHG
jgi:thiamine biosynthesis lipoprotein